MNQLLWRWWRLNLAKTNIVIFFSSFRCFRLVEWSVWFDLMIILWKHSKKRNVSHNTLCVGVQIKQYNQNKRKKNKTSLIWSFYFLLSFFFLFKFMVDFTFDSMVQKLNHEILIMIHTHIKTMPENYEKYLTENLYWVSVYVNYISSVSHTRDALCLNNLS